MPGPSRDSRARHSIALLFAEQRVDELCNIRGVGLAVAGEVGDESLAQTRRAGIQHHIHERLNVQAVD